MTNNSCLYGCETHPHLNQDNPRYNSYFLQAITNDLSTISREIRTALQKTLAETTVGQSDQC